MPGSARISLVLWALIACLLLINGVTIFLFARERRENLRQRMWNAQLRDEAESLRAQREKLLEFAAQSELPSVRVIPAANLGAFAQVKESDLPGRYRWFESEKDRGVISLNPDHSFTSLNGQRSDAYRWSLSRDQLVLEYNRMTIYYTNVEAPGVYVGVRTDRKSQRLEKIE